MSRAFALERGRMAAMGFFVSLETPGYAVCIHRGGCRFCHDAALRSLGPGSYLSWSPSLPGYEAAQAYVRANYSFFAPATDCPECRPEVPDAAIARAYS